MSWRLGAASVHRYEMGVKTQDGLPTLNEGMPRCLKGKAVLLGLTGSCGKLNDIEDAAAA